MKHFFSILSTLIFVTTTYAAPRGDLAPTEPTTTATVIITTAAPSISATSAPSAAPTSPAPSDCERAGVFICENIFWTVPCQLYSVCIGGAPEACTKLDGKASSIGPDEGYKCLFYKTDNCSSPPGPAGGVLTLKYPGEASLFNIPGQGEWNDEARSFQCFKDE